MPDSSIPRFFEKSRKERLDAIKEFCGLSDEDLEILEKALECRKADIEKAQDTGKEYFMELLGDLQEAAKDLEPLTNALVKIKQYSD